MAICKDRAIDYLNELGYNAIRLPREGITPLVVLSRNSRTGISSIFGHITDLVENPDQALPKVWEDLQAGTISGLRTNRLNFDLGISVLATLLSAVGAMSAGIETVFGGAAAIEFEYENVLYDTVMPAAVSNYLRRSLPFIDDELLNQFNERGEAYIIIDVLKSNSFGIRAYRDNGSNVDVNVLALQRILGSTTKLAVEKKADLKVSFRGENALGFGFKACPIWIEKVNGRLRFRLNPDTNQSIELRGLKDEDVDLTPMLISPHELMELA